MRRESGRFLRNEANFRGLEVRPRVAVATDIATSWDFVSAEAWVALWLGAQFLVIHSIARGGEGRLKNEVRIGLVNGAQARFKKETCSHLISA